ncbi:orexin receptor type 2 [Narcine bancroftii]|uniref:orexin receptor type 2 n=1 Tax=Narcine bancroftii TaxID=1343680 RepID=UPI0038323373
MGSADTAATPLQANETNASTALDPRVDYDQEFIQYIWKEYLFPKEWEWVLIAAYIVVFIVALVGNILVCVAVWKNRHMRTVTNYFIVNLSFADILVTMICLPASLLVDITETWFYGQVLCKIIPYLQTVAVSVSVLTLSCIAMDRWYAICHPLMFKSAASRARSNIAMIWIVSCVFMIPQAIVMECSIIVPEFANKTVLFTICDEHWTDEIYGKVYHICFFIVTYVAPLCLMILAYFQIFQKLWCRQIPGTFSIVQRNRKPPALQCSSQRGSKDQTRMRARAITAEIKQIQARRKTARMLVVVLIFFALCYLPVSVLNILKRVLGIFNNVHDRTTLYALFTVSHWLVYTNSAANPIIYNFLSSKFREEFKTAFSCYDGRRHPSKEQLTRRQTNTESHKSLTTQTCHCNISKTVEHMVLANVPTMQPSACTTANAW